MKRRSIHYQMKKIILISSFLIIVFIIFLIVYFHPSKYTLEYKINDILIKESYNKDNKYYLIEINYENHNLSLVSLDKYTTKRKLITDIVIENEDNFKCLKTKSKYLNTYPVCFNEEENVALKYEEKDNKALYNYKGFDVYDLNNKTYLLWNYRNLVWLNNKEKKEIKLFDHDIYNLNLITTYKDSLVIPDYSKDYTFNKLYVINSESGKVKEINLRYEIYFDSYFLGTYKNNLYLYDRKQEQVFYIDMKKGKIYKGKNRILINNKWQNVTTYDLTHNNLSFKNDNIIDYEIKDNILYSKVNTNKFTTKISDNVDAIIYHNNLDVYFLSQEDLYFYNPYVGIKKLIHFSEWNFNKQNMIFIFD